MAAARPRAMRESAPSITFIATALARPILAGSERSILPGPRVMTNIWPRPTSTVKAEKATAVVNTGQPPWPPATATARAQTRIAPRKDQIQGRSRMRNRAVIRVLMHPPG